MSQNLPSRALTLAASNLVKHRALIKLQGQTLDGYQAYFALKAPNGQRLELAEVERIFLNDTATMEAIEATYNRLLAQR